MEEFGHWFGKMLKVGKILDDGSLRSCYMLAIMALSTSCQVIPKACP